MSDDPNETSDSAGGEPPLDETLTFHQSIAGTSWRERLEKLASRASQGERYQHRGEIARGGMGAIMKVWDDDLRRHLAMKVMLGDEGHEALSAKELVDRIAQRVESASTGAPGTSPSPPPDLQRFLDEAQITGQLDHPGVVPVHELGMDRTGRVYFTMSMVRGQDFKKIIGLANRGEKNWSRPRALDVVIKVCETMGYAHSKNVIHRDLKPANVMVGRHGEVYVMDWGLAKVLGDAEPAEEHDLSSPFETLSRIQTDRAADEISDEDDLVSIDGMVIGTPSYMPPEQAKGRLGEVDFRADVYAIGAMLYHLIAGHAPYVEPGDRPSPSLRLAMVVHGPPKSLNAIDRPIPPELIAICEKAMARDPSERYETSFELAQDLKAFRENRVVHAHKTGSLAEFRMWYVRNKRLALGAAATLTVLLGLGIAGLWFFLQARYQDQLRREAYLIEGLAELEWWADQLLPAVPENEDGMRRWLDRVRPLQADLDKLEARLGELAGLATPATEDQRRADRRNHELYPILERISAVCDAQRAAAETESDPDRLSAIRRHIVHLERQIVHFRGLIAGERTLRFEDDPDRELASRARIIGSSCARLRRLLRGMPRESGQTLLRDPTVPGMDARLAFLDRARERLRADEAIWDTLRADLATDRRFAGFDLPPQLGLAPIGRDPASGLWELAYLGTGEIPERDEDGKLRVTGKTAVVFVLVPGAAEAAVGAQASDEADDYFDQYARPMDKPLRTVQLDPFLISKFELTQGQWKRLTGENPSGMNEFFFEPARGHYHSLRHPVENLTWSEAARVLGQLRMDFPTEAQWEIACRAGTTSVFSCGDTLVGLEDCANVRDQAGSDVLDDGFELHSPVGTYEPNDFGLHDMHGNVEEMCRDAYIRHGRAESRPGDGLHGQRYAMSLRAVRGGDFAGSPQNARSARRFGRDPDYRHPTLGVRPIWTIERSDSP